MFYSKSINTALAPSLHLQFTHDKKGFIKHIAENPERAEEAVKAVLEGTKSMTSYVKSPEIREAVLAAAPEGKNAIKTLHDSYSKEI